MTDAGPDKPQDDPLPTNGEPPAEADADAQGPPTDDAPAPAPETDPANAAAGDAYADDPVDPAPAKDSSEPSDDDTTSEGDTDYGGDDWNTDYDYNDEWNEGQYDDWGSGFDGEGWRDDDTPDDGYDDHYQDYDYDHDTELTTWQDDNEPAKPDPAGGAGNVPAKTGDGAVAPADEDEEEELDPEEAELAQSTMSLGDHLDELRVRLIKALAGLGIMMVGTIFFGKQILAVLQNSYYVAMEANGLEPEMVITGVHEGFLTYFKISLIAGMILASPWVFYQLWQFIAAGLYRRERRYVTVAVPFSATLFVTGAAFFLFIVSKPMLMFFIGFSKWMGVVPMIKLKEYVSFITMLMLVFGLAFQTPLVVFLLGKMGLVSLQTLRKYRRHVIVIFLIISAVATSPSPVDQILLALPMYLLYELGVFMVAMAEKKKREEEAAAEEEDRLRSEQLARERGEEP